MFDFNDDTLPRRLFLERCASAAFGLSVLPASLSTSMAAPPTGKPAENGFGKAKHVIFLMIGGGLTHIDTFDPKEDNGPGSAIQNSAGGRFTDYIPEIARVAEKMCVIRSMTAKIGTHKEASYFMRTAFKPIGTTLHPMLGAWAQQLLGRSHKILPSTVCVGRDAGYGNGFLPSSMSPLPILDPEAGLQFLKPTGSVAQLQKQLATLNELDSAFTKRFADRNVKAYSDFYDDAVRLMSGKDGAAFDLTKEPDSLRDAYGKSVGRKGEPGARTKFGQGCLLARRLIESGVRFVEVQFGGWDFHKNLEQGLDELAPELDQGYAQLIRDLDSRGLLGETLVVMTSEFGRTPNISNGGRNHHPPAFSSILAGAGVKGGHIHGATDAKGGAVDREPITVGELHATIGWAMGISPEMEIKSPNGRPFSIGNNSQPVMDLFV